MATTSSIAATRDGDGDADISDADKPFRCGICLELVYKPVVQACGHIFCFWCAHEAMNMAGESHCPICRRPYMYFPRVCRLLHFILQKTESMAYEERREEIQQMEEEINLFSPQFPESPRWSSWKVQQPQQSISHSLLAKGTDVVPGVAQADGICETRLQHPQQAIPHRSLTSGSDFVAGVSKEGGISGTRFQQPQQSIYHSLLAKGADVVSTVLKEDAISKNRLQQFQQSIPHGLLISGTDDMSGGSKEDAMPNTGLLEPEQSIQSSLVSRTDVPTVDGPDGCDERIGTNLSLALDEKDISSHVDENADVIHRVDGGSKHLLSMDEFLCASCHKLLYRPVVLNCGEVFCESCLSDAARSRFCCPTCGDPHYGGSALVCLELHQFLESAFPSEYKKRDDQCTTKEDEKQGRLSQCTLEGLINGQSEVLLHVGCGCDGCGMYPIVGDRYRCLDCTEDVGFDLCGTCLRMGGSLHGRFNQQHKSGHKMIKILDGDMPELFFFEHEQQQHIDINSHSDGDRAELLFSEHEQQYNDHSDSQSHGDTVEIPEHEQQDITHSNSQSQ